jgi:hypothetical protein
MHTMTKKQGKSGTIDVKALLAADEEFLRALVRTALQEVLEAEMGLTFDLSQLGPSLLGRPPAAVQKRAQADKSRIFIDFNCL